MSGVSSGVAHEFDLEQFSLAVLEKNFVGQSEVSRLLGGVSSLPTIPCGKNLKKMIEGSRPPGQTKCFVLCPNKDSMGRVVNVEFIQSAYREACGKDLIFFSSEGLDRGDDSLYKRQIFEDSKWMFFTNKLLSESINTDCFRQTYLMSRYVRCMSAGMDMLPSVIDALEEFDKEQGSIEPLFGSASFGKDPGYARNAMDKLFGLKLNALFRPTAEMVIYYLAVMSAAHGYNPLADNKCVCTRSLSPRGLPINVSFGNKGIVITEGGMNPIKNTGTWVAFDPKTLVSL